VYIDQLNLENLRTFAGRGKKALVFVHPDRDYRPAKTAPTPEDERLPRPRLPNVTLLLGDNGSGKTTILRAIAASAFGPAAKDLLRDSSLVRRGEKLAKIFAVLRLHEQDRAADSSVMTVINLVRKGERLEVETGAPPGAKPDLDVTVIDPHVESVWGPVYESENDSFFVVGYGATRRVERLDSYDAAARSRSRASRDLRVQSLFEEAFSLIPLGSWLPSLQSRNPERYTEVVELVNSLLGPGHYSFSGEQGKNGDYLLYRGEMPVPIQALSDGYRAFVGWVADLLYHVCFGCPPGKKLVESCGIVLVDEIDLHLHPKWQMKVISTVAKALPKMQFVFTSHSPLVAGSLEWMNIITLKVGTKTNRTVAKRLKQSIHGLDADQILISDFFGLKSTMAGAKRRQLDDITNRIRSGDKNAPLELIREMSSGTEVEE
jgi:AAA domain, putative AbiEii toxin, Type IV TA system